MQRLESKITRNIHLPISTVEAMASPWMFLTSAILFFITSQALPTAPDIPALSVVDTVDGPLNLENIAVRSNGKLLVTSVSSPTIFQISANAGTPPIAVATIPTLTATLGIVELVQDIFYVVASNLTGLDASNEIWEIDMRQFRTTRSGSITHPAALALSARVPHARLLNGITRLAADDSTHILVADSAAGTVTRINVRTGDLAVVHQDPTMSIRAGGLGVGINGIHTFGSDLFFTNLDQALFVRVPISPYDGTATGPMDIILNGTMEGADDFVLSRDGTKAWIAENGVDVLREVDIASKTSRVAANCTLLGSISAAALGRTCSDQNTIYITGAATVNGTAVNGQVIKATKLF